MNDELSFELLTVDNDEILIEPAATDAVMGHPSTVLIVDANAGLRRRFKERFWRAGYQVREASTALGAYELAKREPIDVCLVELTLPDSDGWGLLSVFRNDARLAEIKIVLMGGQRAQLAEIARVRIGADGYVAKSGDVVSACHAAISRRLGIIGSLAKGAWGPLADVGVQSLMHAACERRLRGRLSVDDGVTAWCVHFEDGVIATAEAFCLDAEAAIRDRDALRTLLEVENAPFTFEAVDPDVAHTLDASWAMIAAPLCDELNARRARTHAHVLSLPRPLAFDLPRFRCWSRQAAAPFVAIARVLLEGAPPATLVDESSWPRTSIEFVVNDLVRRGVARIS